MSEMNRRIRRLCAATTLLALLGHILIATPGGGEAVLCIGEDGHFGLKLTQSGSCREFPGAFPRTRGQPWSGNAFASTRNHCGDCVDVPVSPHTPGKQFVARVTCRKEFSRDTVNSNGTVPPFSVVVACDVLRVASLEVKPALESIRTVVLLI